MDHQIIKVEGAVQKEDGTLFTQEEREKDFMKDL
jgi:hypothetical protein